MKNYLYILTFACWGLKFFIFIGNFTEIYLIIEKAKMCCTVVTDVHVSIEKFS